MWYEEIGLEAHSPEEAMYLFSLWSTVRAIEKCGFDEFSIVESLYQAIYSLFYTKVVPIGRGVV